MTRVSDSLANVVLASLILVALVCAPLLHSVLPHAHASHAATHATSAHTHTHSHTPATNEAPEESPIWTSLHSALRHEDKKVLLDTVLVLSLFIFSVLTFRFFIPVFSYTEQCLRIQRSRPRIPSEGEWLMSGISPYRRFA